MIIDVRVTNYSSSWGIVCEIRYSPGGAINEYVKVVQVGIIYMKVNIGYEVMLYMVLVRGAK
jgi:hypothetical protein